MFCVGGMRGIKSAVAPDSRIAQIPVNLDVLCRIGGGGGGGEGGVKREKRTVELVC